jgi:hypothetical protein
MQDISNLLQTQCVAATAQQPITCVIPQNGKPLAGFAWDWIPTWVRTGLVETEFLAAVLEQLFFPKWCDFLREWIKTGDLDEIVAWYLFWKGHFYNEFIAKGFLIDVFMEVLQMMHSNIPQAYVI